MRTPENTGSVDGATGMRTAVANVDPRRETAIDALVTDLTMPGDDGIALIRKARAIDNTLPAILLTGYAEQLAPTAGSQFQVLRKPVHIDRLVEQLRLLVFEPAA